MSQLDTRAQRRTQLSPAKQALLAKLAGGKGTAQRIGRRANNQDAPLSFAQQRLWFLDQLAANPQTYVMYQAMRITGVLDVAVLRRSINAIVERHATLRTTFPMVDGQTVQHIAPALDVPLDILDLQGFPPAAREGVMEQWVTQLSRQPFDLVQGPLLRTKLIRLSEHDHVLVLTMHHIIADSWSLGIIMREVSALCAVFGANSASPLPELPVQYADYAVWQHNAMQGATLERHMTYWKQQLGGELPVLELPGSATHRAAAAITAGACYRFVVPAPVTAALKGIAQREGATLFMVLLAAYNALLHRYTGLEDVCIGTTIANRNQAEIENLIGFFANTLVLRTTLSGELSFRDLLGRVREVALDAYAHQDLPFERLVEELQPDRAAAHTPLFQTMLVLQNTPVARVELPHFAVQALDVHNGTAKFDLLLNLWEADGELVGVFEYREDVFDAALIGRLAEHLHVLLGGVAANPDQPIAHVPLMTAKEQRTILNTWHTTPVPAFAETLHQAVERQAAQRPNACAVTCGDVRLSYRELNQRANQLAHHLRALGVGPNVLVGMCLERSADMIVGLLGILKAGGAYLPLDLAYPKDRLAFMLADAQAPVLLTQQALLDQLPEHSAHTICLATGWDAIAKCSDDNPTGGATADDLAYVIYTSGSTGKPKGVQIEHRHVARLFSATDHWYGFNERDVWTLFHSYAFDFSVWEIWGALVYGGRLVVVPYLSSRSPENFYELLCQEQVTVLNQTPSAFKQLMRAEEQRGATGDLHLRLVIFGGEALDLPSLTPWFERHGDQQPQLVNMYGITETTVHVTYRPLTSADAASGTGSMIGCPIPDLELYVLDAHQQLVPFGVPGELYVGGAGVARGYLNRLELTAQRFLASGLAWQLPNGATHQTSRLYRTGDLARLLPNGDLEYLGRIDQQVKIRGFRIELGEIDAVLAAHTSVDHATVLVREDTPGDKRLVAYVVPRTSGYVSSAQDEAWNGEQVAQWETVFDDYYTRDAASDDATFNIIGWNSSYTGQPIPANDMREWVDHTVERIRALAARRVMEIGCGTGMLVARLAPSAGEYLATDFSEAAIAYIERTLRTPERPLAQLRLEQRTGDDFAGIAPRSFDAVVINSVAQYFPSIDYLVRVLEGAAACIALGGAIFVGDNRSLPLQRAFHSAVELFRATPDTPVARLHERIAKRIAHDEELVIDPAFFVALKRHIPHISHVEILHKRGQAHNELTRFRYDVVLHIGGAAPAPLAHWVDWQQRGLTLADVEHLLADVRPASVGIACIPNARLMAEVQAARLLASEQCPATAHELETAVQAQGVDPEALWELGDRYGYHISVVWAGPGAEEYCDVILSKCTNGQPPTRLLPTAFATLDLKQPWHWYASNPLHKKHTQTLVPALREHMRGKLPEYMVPSAFFLLDALPLTPNGKLDRRALPTSEQERGLLDTSYVAPSNALEQQLAAIWAQTLNLGRVGAQDNFFDLGGHSLLATQLIFRIRDALHCDVPLRVLFETPTVAGMAQMIQQLQKGKEYPFANAAALDAEVQLDDDITTYGLAAWSPAPPRRVLLTGATGFLGAFLLAELLKRTDAEVCCLVRAASPEQGLIRLHSSLCSYGLWREAYSGRITPVVGDLAQPLLGLSAAQFAELSATIDIIYHNGALVNFVYPYSQLRAANVLGTQEVLRLASRQRVKPVHFVSSLYVFADADSPDGTPLDEQAVPCHGGLLPMGYTQSKWVSEQLVVLARQRGIPTAIYRPGRVAGHSQSGIGQTDDFLWKIVKACIDVGKAPPLDFPVDIAPADYISQAVVHLSQQPEALGQAFHLFNQQPLPWSDMVAWLQAFGYPIERVSYDEWRNDVLALAEQGTERNTAALGSLLVGSSSENATSPLCFAGNATQAQLDAAAIACPPVDAHLLHTYARYFVATGFFAKPAQKGAPHA